MTKEAPVPATSSRLCAFFCVLVAVAATAFCEPESGSEAQLTVAGPSPYRFGLASVPGQPILYRPERVTYYLRLPDGYTADSARALVLAVSPSGAGRDLFAPWEKAAAAYGFIFACPDKAGNPVRTDVRGQTVMDVLHDVCRRYAVDPERIFLTGFSGGARMATGVALKFPGLFAGLVPLGGVVYNETPAALADLKVKRGVYLFAGELDFNRAEAERAAAILADASVPVALMIGPGIAHAQPEPDQCLEICRWFAARGARP